MFGTLGGVAEQVVASLEVPLERLEGQICEGAAHLAARGVGRWLLLVGDFDRRKGYERWECRSAAFWLNWHCGISVRTARDQVRVGRALGVPPHLRGPVHNARHLDTYYDEDGSLVGMFRLGPDECAALLAALTLGKDVLRHQKRSAERSGAQPAPKPEADGSSPTAHSGNTVGHRHRPPLARGPLPP